MNILENLTIVIPIGPDDNTWTLLLSDLKPHLKQVEVLFVYSDDIRPNTRLEKSCRDIKWISSPQGRAKQLNTGAGASHRDFLWFLHSDTRLSEDSISQLQQSL